MDTFAQGEIYARKVDQIPDSLSEFTEKLNGAWVISHSESGNHHIIPENGVTVMERTNDVPVGVRILYAIVDSPTELKQDASDAHEAHKLDGGSVYEMRIAREYDPFLDQARQVAD